MAIALLLISFFIGSVSLHTFRFRDLIEKIDFILLVGLSFLGIIGLTIGSFSLQLAVFAVGFTGLICAVIFFRITPRLNFSDSKTFIRFELGEQLGLLVVLFIVAMSLFTALAPPTAWDVGVAHLALPALYNRVGYIFITEANAYSAYPHLVHVLYTLAYFWGNEISGQLLGWIWGILLCASAYSLSSRLHSQKTGILAASLIATTPLFIDQCGTASIDLAFAAYALASLSGFCIFLNEKNLLWLGVSGFLAGSSCGIRHTGYLVVVLLLLGSLIHAKIIPNRRKIFVIFLVGISIGVSPWLLRNIITVRNPFYPFFNEFFQSAKIPDAAITIPGTHESIRLRGLWGLLAFLWKLTMNPQLFDGWQKSAGATPLIFGVPGMFLGGKIAFELGIFALLGLTAFFFFQQHARYMFPFLSCLCVTGSIFVVRMNSLRWITNTILGITWVIGCLMVIGNCIPKIPVALGMKSKVEYLENRVERYGAFLWANQNLPKDAYVLLLDPRGLYYNGFGYQNVESLKYLIDKPLPTQLKWLRERNIRYIMLPMAYVTESPGFAQTGLLELFKTWLDHPEQFKVITHLSLRRIRKNGDEEVYFLEVNDGP